MRAELTTDTPRDQFDDRIDAVVGASRWLESTTPTLRAALLRKLGRALADNSADLVEVALIETGLGVERLAGEVSRAANQFRLYSEVIEEGSWAGISITSAQPEARPPVNDHRRMNIPLGPVMVFAASNFPFAFGIAGTDTASALAAGCAVLAKGHPGHPRLAARLAEIMAETLAEANYPEAVFTLVGPGAVAVEVLRDERIAAGAFTGSISGGTALLEIAQRRAVPIPFFAEMGSVNPVVVTEAAWHARKDEILDGLVTSMTQSNGQLCTSPGLLFVPKGTLSMEELSARIADFPPQPMLTDSIAVGFHRGVTALAATPGVAGAAGASLGQTREAAPMLWLAGIDALEQHPAILEERFGPSSVVVEYLAPGDLDDVIEGMVGQLTASIFCEPQDDVSQLVALLSRKAGRVLLNSWPTGVAVSWSMHHGGPWPASSSIQTGSVGAEALMRFLRPVVYQNFPDAVLPAAVRDANPWGLPRRVDGVVD